MTKARVWEEYKKVGDEQRGSDLKKLFASLTLTPNFKPALPLFALSVFYSSVR